MRQTLKKVAPIYLLAFILIILGEAGFLKLPPFVERLATEVGVALLAVASIHILDHDILIKETAKKIESQSREMFDKALKGATGQMTGDVGKAINEAKASIVADVTSQTGTAFADASQILQRQVESIKVMEESNLVAVYPSRSSAASTISAAMANSREVWLMGISLNEFCRDEPGPFREAWDYLVEEIKAGRKRARILLIDPYCHGAVLRSYSETANTAGARDRLEGDVISAARLFYEIRKELGAKCSDLDVRIYRLAPTCFICRLDSVIFTQSYHFWKKRLVGCALPLFQYRRRGPGHEGFCIHTELERHYNFIWDHVSIRLDELGPEDPKAPKEHFLPWPTRGLEWGAHTSGMQTVFRDRSRPNTRMREVLRQSRKIWIQGITLKAFFDDSALSKALEKRIIAVKELEKKIAEATTNEEKDAYARQKADIRIMLLNPDCDQAKTRAYREFRLNSKVDCSVEDFVRDHYHESRLWKDLQATITKIKTDGVLKVIPTKQYESAPHMFVLIGEESAFVEQYSYGKLAKRSIETDEVIDEVILGSDMPLIEYRESIDPIYDRILKGIQTSEDGHADELRPQPYPLLSNHFSYAWSQAKDI